jgi:predicted amidohydrolase
MRSTSDREANLERVRTLVEEAARRGARLVCLPENFGWLDREGRKIDVAETPEDGPSVGLARELAARLGIHVAAGSVALRTDDPGRTTNTQLVFGPDGSLLARYDKIHLFDVDIDAEHSFRESRYVQPGDRVVTVDVDGWRVGLSICYDLRFPELYRELAGRGAAVLLVPSAFTARTGRDHWETLLRARAIENLCYVAAAAQWGRHNDRRESHGDAMIVDPWGEILARMPEGEGVLVADLEADRLEAVRRALPALEHRRLGV